LSYPIDNQKLNCTFAALLKKTAEIAVITTFD